jgi:hypothetical protein
MVNYIFLFIDFGCAACFFLFLGYLLHKINSCSQRHLTRQELLFSSVAGALCGGLGSTLGTMARFYLGGRLLDPFAIIKWTIHLTTLFCIACGCFVYPRSPHKRTPQPQLAFFTKDIILCILYPYAVIYILFSFSLALAYFLSY